jgi:hypothetical protein
VRESAGYCRAGWSFPCSPSRSPDARSASSPSPRSPRRGPRVPQSFVYDVVASSDWIVYAAATQLLRRASDGTWAVVDVDLARAYGVYPGRNGLVFALGNYPSPDGKSAIAFTTGAGFQFYPLGNCDHPAGSVEHLYCVRERVEKSPPPPDLR